MGRIYVVVVMLESWKEEVEVGVVVVCEGWWGICYGYGGCGV